MPNLDTEEWRVSSYLDYVPKKTHEYVECTNCGGSGTIGGGFKWIGEPETCTFCHGSGLATKYVYPKEPKPELPQEFVDWMKKAYLEYKLK